MKTIFRSVMLMTRFACLLVGTSVVLVSLPVGLLAAAAPQGEPMTPGWQIILGVVALAVLLASGFLMFAFVGTAPMSIAFQIVNAMLLLLPLGSGLLLILSTRLQIPTPGLAYAMTAASIWVLFLCCVTPRRGE